MPRIAGAFGPGVISEETATIGFWDFTGQDRVSVRAADARIDPSDPRHDWLFKNAQRYFAGTIGERQYRVVYLPARLSVAGTWLRMASLMGWPAAGTWRLADFDPLPGAVSLVAFLVYAALLTASVGSLGRPGRAVAAAGAASWLPLVLAGGTAGLAVCFLCYPAWLDILAVMLPGRAWDRKLLREARGPLLRLGAAFMIGLAVALPGAGATPAALAGYLGPLAACLLILAARLPSLERAHSARRRRTAFRPVPIVRAVDRTYRARTAALVLASAALVFSVTFPRGGGAVLPRAGGAAAGGFGWRGIERLAQTRGETRLPDLADLAMHEAYQQSLGFGRAELAPVEDERVRVREYLSSPGTGRITARERTVKSLDAVWLRSVQQDSGGQGLATLLAAQGRPVRAAQGRLWITAVRDLPAFLLGLGVIISRLLQTGGVQPLIRGILLRFTTGARRGRAS
jgi:hypothetical protein